MEQLGLDVISLFDNVAKVVIKLLNITIICVYITKALLTVIEN